MNPKKMLVDIIASDQRIRDYNKSPTKENADRCIKAYEEAVATFCEEFDELTPSNQA